MPCRENAKAGTATSPIPPLGSPSASTLSAAPSNMTPVKLAMFLILARLWLIRALAYRLYAAPDRVASLSNRCLFEYPIDEKTIVTKLPQPRAKQKRILSPLAATLQSRALKEDRSGGRNAASGRAGRPGELALSHR
jgi:hypothetical protein